MGHFGDSGSGALIREGEDLYIAGVKSHGENGHWGSSHAYTRAGGELTRPWIEANLASLDERVPVESCEAYEVEEEYYYGDEYYGEDEAWYGDEAGYGEYGEYDYDYDDDYYYEARDCGECDYYDDECWDTCEWSDDSDDYGYGDDYGDYGVDCNYCEADDYVCQMYCLYGEDGGDYGVECHECAADDYVC